MDEHEKAMSPLLPGERGRSSALTESARKGKDLATPFDRWLNAKLSELYGPVLREPIPDELVKLIEAHRGSSEDN